LLFFLAFVKTYFYPLGIGKVIARQIEVPEPKPEPEPETSKRQPQSRADQFNICGQGGQGARLGVTDEAVSQYEQGKTKPRDSVLILIEQLERRAAKARAK